MTNQPTPIRVAIDIRKQLLKVLANIIGFDGRSNIHSTVVNELEDLILVWRQEAIDSALVHQPLNRRLSA